MIHHYLQFPIYLIVVLGIILAAMKLLLFFVFNAFLVVVVIDVVLVVVADEKIKCFHHYCVTLLMFHHYGELQAGANQVPTGNYEQLVNLHSFHFCNCCCGGVSLCYYCFFVVD